MMPARLKQGDKVLNLLQEKYPNYHPLIGVAKIAHSTNDARLEFDCHKTLAEFVEPKLKSIETHQNFSEDSELKVIFEGEFTEVSSNDGAPALEDQSESPPALAVEAFLDGDIVNLELGSPTVIEPKARNGNDLDRAQEHE
jgi:hypothetical protein